MFGIGSTELVIIFIVALVVLGPKSIPKLAKTIGKAMGEFRRVSTEFQRTMNVEAEMEDHEKRKKEAEEELFGSNTESKDTPKDTKKASKSEPYETDDNDNAATPSDLADKANTTKDAQENIVDTTLSEDTPLAQAVKKAADEADENSKDEKKHESVAQDKIAQKKDENKA